MTYRAYALKARTGAAACAALLGFSIPISPAGDGILVGLIALAWLACTPYLREWMGSSARDVPVTLALALFAVLAAAALVNGVPAKAAGSALSKYIDLALIPVFAWAATTYATRRRALYAFLAAIGLSLCISFGTALGLWESLPGLRTHSAYPVGFKLSVTHNILVSIAAYALLLLARDLRVDRPRTALVMLALALACIYNVLFIVIGRTGYVVLAALVIYFAYSVSRSRRSVLLAGLVLTALFAGAYFGSQYFPARMQDVAADLTQWRSGAGDESSVGQRIGYYRTTLEIIREHPLAGVGPGAFADAYAEKVRGTSAPATHNPHNDYLMIAAQAGLPALALLIALYVALWRQAPRLGSPLERDLMRGLVLTMAIGGLFNTLLMDHVEGLLFAWGTGLLHAGLRGARAT